ncbi:MAG: hypothetical protein ACRDE2_13890, partial [Chitinophagaceae bacterium]
NSQINKGHWLMGGNANYSLTYYNTELNGGQENTVYSLRLMPNLGYFFIDKLSSGLKVSVNGAGRKATGTSAYTFELMSNLGPFVRYYFLPAGNIVNVLMEGSYQYGIVGGHHKIVSTRNIFAVAAGPVIYFNSSLGLECLVNYSTYKFIKYSGSNQILTLSLGIQAYLEKDK